MRTAWVPLLLSVRSWPLITAARRQRRRSVAPLGAEVVRRAGASAPTAAQGCVKPPGLARLLAYRLLSCAYHSYLKLKQSEGLLRQEVEAIKLQMDDAQLQHQADMQSLQATVDRLQVSCCRGSCSSRSVACSHTSCRDCRRT